MVPFFDHKFVLGPETELFVCSNPNTWFAHHELATLAEIYENAKGGYTHLVPLVGLLYSETPSLTIPHASQEEFLSALSRGVIYLPK